MGELWDIYDENRRKTGKIAERDVTQLKEGEYHVIVNGIILNLENKILIDKRRQDKKHGGLWECSGGSILKGENSLEGILRELREELGIIFSEKEAIFLKEIKRVKTPCNFKDLWLFRRDIKDEEITMPDGEATEFKWVTIDEFMDMFEKGEIISTVDFGREEYKLALEKLNRLSNITLKMYDVEASGDGFHTKGYIFRKDEIYRIIIGSSNMTKTALTSNREWNTRVVSTEKGEIAQNILDEFNELWNSEYALKYDEFYEIYKERYKIIKKQREIAKSDEKISRNRLK